MNKGFVAWPHWTSFGAEESVSHLSQSEFDVL